jgi:hypothetical protein
MITVCLPVYASEIAWLAMESLCNQFCQCPWELIIHEDEQYPLGEEFYMSYRNRLRKAGCINIAYEYSKTRTPLSYKWLNMSKQSHPLSIGIILQGADNYSNYSEPYRIQRSYDKMKAGYDWIYSPRAVFYQIQKKKTLLYELKKAGIGADMCIATELAVQLPREIKWQSVDSWIHSSLLIIKPDLKVYEDETNSHLDGIATDGNNRISKGRRELFDNPKPPFYETNIKASDCIPLDMILKLNKWGKENPL